MAGLFRSNRVNNQTPVATALRVQTSLQGRPVPIGCGRTRWAGALIDYDGFSATPAKSPGSKGGLAGSAGKGNTGQYDYSCSALISLGEGPVVEIEKIFNGNAIDFLTAPSALELADLATIGIPASDITTGNATYNTISYSGSYTQAADSWWSAQFGARALAYRGQAYVVFPNLALGSSPSVPNFNFEATWSISSDIPALGPDANPADWIQAFLTNADWGVPGFPSSALGDFSTARNYWRATGLLISTTLTSPVAANSHLKELMTALNAEFRWSAGNLDIVPRGDVAVTGNGYAYTPNTTPVYNLGVNDFLPNQGGLGASTSSGKVAVAFSRASVFDVPNKIQVEYLDRANLYNPVVIYATDDAAITAQNRLRLSDLKQNHFFCLGAAASLSAALQLNRLQAGINTYQVTVGRQFALLDPLDLVTLTDPASQLVNQLVRIVQIDENADSTLTLTCEEVPLTASAPVYNRQASLGVGRNNNLPPSSVNPPIFFEPPDQLGQGLVLLIGLSGAVPANWGGCQVWASSDGTNYAPIGVTQSATRMGVLTAALASVSAAVAGATIDSVNTLAVNLSESGALLSSVSPTAFAVLATASVVDSEVLAYETATLTGANAYNLTTLSRGAYGSSIVAHAAGAPFMRIDGSAFEWNFTSDRIGQTIYFKFTSFNVFGAAEQNLSDVGAYVYTIQGSALSSPLPDVENLRATFENGFLSVYWDEIEDFRSGVVYEIRQGASPTTALVLRTQAHPPFKATGDGTYWIAARCTPTTGLTVYSGAWSEIEIAGSQLALNLVATWDEKATGWAGSFQNGIGVAGGDLRLGGAGNILAAANFLGIPDLLNYGGIIANQPVYYTIPPSHIVNLGYVGQASITATSEVVGVPMAQNFLGFENFLAVADFLGAVSTQYVSGWAELSISQDGTTWGAWQKLDAGVFLGMAFNRRFALETADSQTIPEALAFATSVQVKSRIDHYQNLSVPSGGLTITFTPDGAPSPGAFNGGPGAANLPFVSVSWQPQAGDSYVISGETLSGLTIQFFNGGAAVARSGVNLSVEGY
jgi:hypothetical protein